MSLIARIIGGPLVSVTSYNEAVAMHVIGNPVPTPEELAENLGLSRDRVDAVRRIMSTPTRAKKSAFAAAPARKGAAKKASPKRTRRIAAQS